MDGNELSDVLASLRENLEKAHEAGKNSNVRFLMDEIQIELNLTTSGKVGADGGIKFWVMNFTAKAETTDSRAQKITLKMKMVDKDGNPLPISDRDTR
jgi:hypothetical protein